MSTRTFSRSLICLVLFLLGAHIAHAQTPAITYQRYDTAITIQPDGNFLVREIQQIRFDGEFHTAFAEIPTDLTTEIRNVQIYEGETAYRHGDSVPNTFSSGLTGNSVFVSWEYTPTVAGDVRTFVLEYEVVGGLWVYPEQTVLEWRAVPADRSGIEVENSVVTVTLPAKVAADQLQFTAYGPSYQTTTSPTEVAFSASEAIPDGTQFQVQVGFPANLVAAERQPWQVQEDNARLEYRFTALDVDLNLQPDGTMLVDEYHHLAVDAGALDQGERVIPLRFLDGVDQISLYEGEERFVEGSTNCIYCLQIDQTPQQSDWIRYDPDARTVVTNESHIGSVNLNWQFPPLVRGEETSLRLSYRVLGAVRHLPDRQEIKWSAVFADRNQTVEAAQVRLHLPPGVANDQVKLAGGNMEWQSDGSALITAPNAYPPGRRWEVTIGLPVNATSGAVPQWQAMIEAAANEAVQAEIWQARLRLGFGVGSILLLLLGVVSVYLLWFLLGRDRPMPAVTDYLPEPPSNLPPAIVAYLIDEAPSVKGALASLFHLANLGLIWIRFDDMLALKRVEEKSVSAGDEVKTATGETVALPHHLATLYNALQAALPVQEETAFHHIYGRFQLALPAVYADMGDETNRFFDELPPQARHRWLVRGQWLVILAVVAALLLAWRYYGELGWLAVAPAAASVVAGIALIIASRWMPRRTSAGVEETQRWIAFRNFLTHLKQYGNLDQAQRILDRYFAYAVALGVEEIVLQQASDMGSSIPNWSYTPTWEPRRDSTTQPNRPTVNESQDQPATSSTSLPPLSTPSTSQEASPTSDAPRPRPSLSRMSRQLSSSLTDASQSLETLLTSAVSSDEASTPFGSLWQGTQAVGEAGANVASGTLDILGEILESAASGDGGGSYHSSGSSSSSWSSSSSRSSSSSSSSFSSGRSSSERRSGGGGKRGFG
ncbi:MAG: DUF2207 domain-containing protein [Caldilineaceae bacterium]